MSHTQQEPMLGAHTSSALVDETRVVAESGGTRQVVVANGLSMQRVP